MKKLFFLGAAFMLFFAANSFAQSYVPAGAPNCGNDGVVNAIVNSQSAQGWDFAGSTYQPINYLVQPEAPYVAGTINLSFVPHCEPFEICIQIIKLEQVDVIVKKNGGCIYQRK